jgi:N-acetylglucosamine-6-phosphate deacetylase
VALAVRAKSTRLAMAITDGTAGSGLPAGSRARLGSQPIVVTATSALLKDGTLAGSILTMDGAFRTLVERVGLSLPEAAQMCASTPAERLGLADCGRLEPGLLADLAVLGAGLRVRQTYVGGIAALEH